ncbi:hypothetical protein ACE2AJ_01585 [Aquihabitans daechungensis]|uniref:hypothetical protein n=1 Tax=Aquihabitans daechungensis TaxID=1052257 RepID=UPI003BA26C45
MTRLRALLLLALAVLVPWALPTHAVDAQADGPEQPRLLVVSLPGVTWADVQGHELPNLDAFLEDAAMADLAPRSVTPRSGPGDAYLTISGGSRATTVPEIDGQVLAVDEESIGTAAGDIYRRRTGNDPSGPYVSLAWPSLVRANEGEPYETEIGTLTDTLEDGSVSAAAIGNADGTDSIGPSYERQVGLSVADHTGVIPDGSLGKDLLEPAPEQPFGVRLDLDVVGERFEAIWARPDRPTGEDGSLVVVEASDLARTLRYRPIVDDERYDEMWAQSLEQSDELLGRLVESVDPETDTVMVLAPYNRAGDRDLTMVAVAGPEISPGYLRSASTQRSGFLTLVDIGPTILDTFGIARPTAMEGRPVVDVASGDSVSARVDHLVTRNRESRHREQLLTPTTTLVVVLMAVVLALAIAAHANRWGRRGRATVAFAGLVDLTILPASYLARFFALEDHPASFYWMFLLGTALVVPAVACALARGRGATRAPLVTVLSLMGLVLIGDVVSGSHLSLGAAFGYSPTGNSRLYGISNYSYGQLAAAACLVAAWLAAVLAGRRGRIAGIGLMVAVLVVLGVPTWGSDVGGVLAFTPAVATFAVLVTGRRIRLRTLVIGVGATAGAILAFGLLDLARAPSDRGHLGRLFERIGDEGPSPVIAMVQRKLTANLAVSTSSLWVLAIPLAIAFWLYLRRSQRRPFEAMAASFATLPAGLWAALVAAVLGSALNDSGAIIGGIVAMVLATSLAVLLVDDDASAEPAQDPVPEPVQEPVRAEATSPG